MQHFNSTFLFSPDCLYSKLLFCAHLLRRQLLHSTHNVFVVCLANNVLAPLFKKNKKCVLISVLDFVGCIYYIYLSTFLLNCFEMVNYALDFYLKIAQCFHDIETTAGMYSDECLSNLYLALCYLFICEK